MSDTPMTEVVPNDDVVLIAVRKRALDEPTATRIMEEVANGSIAAPTKPVVIDFAKVEFVPSSALGALVRLAQSMRLSGCRLILVNVDRRVRGSLNVTRLDKVIEIRQTLEDALYVLKKGA